MEVLWKINGCLIAFIGDFDLVLSGMLFDHVQESDTMAGPFGDTYAITPFEEAK